METEKETEIKAEPLSLIPAPETPEVKPKKKPHRWVKGECGNPAGRPPGSLSLLAILKDKLNSVPKGGQKTYAAMVIEKMIKKALVDEDSRMLSDLMNRIDGLPKQRIEMEKDLPVIIKIARDQIDQ